MIVRQDGDRLILILQTDHAAISGWLAEHWGNDAFDRPDPFDSVVYAAARHDDGWIPWEKAPKVDPETRLPYQFTDLPIDEHWGFYSTGLAELAEQDPYAALLSSMHLAGLYRMKLAAGTEWRTNDPRRNPREIGQACVRKLETQQQQLRDALGRSGDPAGPPDDDRLRVNLRWLQLVDLLSLNLCTAPVKDATFGPVPRNYRGDEAKLAFRCLDPQTLAVAPYPFSEDPLRISVDGRSIPNEPYDGDQSLQEALARAESVALSFALLSA